MSPEHIVTHAGRAHRDDFFAVGLANVIFATRPGEVMRVFRREPTDEELDDPDVLVLDVGGRLQPERLNFDHHQLSRGSEECALSLMARHFKVEPCHPHLTYHDLWEEAPWYRGVVLQDALGIGGLAKKLGLSTVPEELVSGIEVFCLQEFGQGAEVPREWVEFAAAVVRAKVQTALEFRKQMERLEAHHEVRPFGKDSIFWAPEVTPFGVNRFIEKKGWDVVATVTRDPRSGGLCLYRINERLDFSRISGEEGVIFAHRAGFMATVQPGTTYDRVVVLLGIACKEG